MRRPEFAEGAGFRRYWLAAGAALGVGWVAATALGAVLAPALPAGSALDVAAPALFLAMLVPMLGAPPALVGAVVAALTAAAAAPLPNGLGVLCGMATGLLAGSLTERRTS